LQEHPLLKAVLLRFVKKIPDIRLIKSMQLVAVGKWMPVFRKHLSLNKLREQLHDDNLLADADAGTENVITYTSGTLSTPKGVLHSSASLSASIQALCTLFKKDQQAIVGAYLPHFLLLGIAAGLPVKLMKADLSATKKIDFIKKENIGILFGPPSDYLPMILHCEETDQLLPAVLQHVLIGSAPAHASFLKRLLAVLPSHTRVTCTYGMTENLLVAVIDGREKAGYAEEGDILGKPVQGIAIRIAEDGEILVRSPQLFSRYFHEQGRPDWHASGDLGRIDAEGNIVLMGRKKEMIIRRNMNIYPALYENTIKHIKGIDEAAMVGVYHDDIHDEKVYLALEGNSINISSVKKQLAQGKHSIDAEALPDVIFTMTIPRKGRQNKIDRNGIVDYIRKNDL
jgi:acyl-CoA synthetase (AMP-forming)/AMP-acid ligase II